MAADRNLRRTLPHAVLERLLDSGLRLATPQTEADLHRLVVDETLGLLGAQRVLLLRPEGQGLQIAHAHLPPGEDAGELLRAISPWLAEAARTRASRLRHGPDGAEAQHQRSCLVALLVADKRVLGFVYADVEGSAGRFNTEHRTLLTRLAGFAAAALAKLQSLRSLQQQAEADALAMRQALQRQTATAEVLQVISSSVSDAQPVLDKILESCSHLFDALTMNVLLIGDDGLLHLAAWRTDPSPDDLPGWTAADLERNMNAVLPLFPMPLTPSAGTALAIASGRVQNFPDVLNGADMPPGVRAPAQMLGLNYSQMLAPLMQGGRGIGSITLQRAALGGFTAEEQELLASFADQAVIAIQNARLFNDTQQALAHQTATADILAVISESPTDVGPVFQAIAERARVLCKADVGATTRLEGNLVHLAGVRSATPQAEEAMRRVFPVPLDEAPRNIRRAVTEGVPVQIPDVRLESGYTGAAEATAMGVLSIMSVPLLHEGRAIGTIGVARREPGLFPDAAVTLLQTFARQAVIAIQNVHLFNETQEALAHQTATSEVLQVISRSTFDLKPVFRTLVESAVRLCGAQTGMIFRRRGDLMHLEASECASAAFIEYVHAHPIAPGRGSVTGRAALEARTVHVLDVENDPEYRYGGQTLERYRSIVAVPLLRDGQPLGVFALWRHHVAAFTPRQIALVETFADQAVIAIQNARLFNATQEALAHQTASADILRVISSSPTDVQPVFEAIVTTAVKHLGATSR